MSYFLKHSHFFDQPVWLTDLQQQNPYEVLHDFSTDYTLSELRQYLYEMAETCLTTENPPFNCPERRANLLLFQVKTEMLFEAISIILKQRENDSRANPSADIIP